MNETYHAFWINPYGMHPMYRDSVRLEPLLDLVKQSHAQDSEIRSLRIVYGVLLEFEPATVVETYRVKETNE